MIPKANHRQERRGGLIREYSQIPSSRIRSGGAGEPGTRSPAGTVPGNIADMPASAGRTPDGNRRGPGQKLTDLRVLHGLSTTVPVLPADHDVDESCTGTSSRVRDRLRAGVYGQRTCAERVGILRTGDGDEIKAQGNSCRYTPRPRSASEYLDTSARSGVRNNDASSYRGYSSVTVQRSHGVTPLPDVGDNERTRPGTRTSRRGKQYCYDS